MQHDSKLSYDIMAVVNNDISGFYPAEEKFEDTKGIIRCRKSKMYRQYKCTDNTMAKDKQ